MSSKLHFQELKMTYAAYEPYLASISSGTTSSASCRSFSSLNAAEQEKLHTALKGLAAHTPDALLALCAALAVEGKRTDPDSKVQARMVQAWMGMDRPDFYSAELTTDEELVALLEARSAVPLSVFPRCLFALYSFADMGNSGGVSLTRTDFAMMWRVPGGVQLECNQHWAEWLEGRKAGLLDLLENDDFWNSAPFRSQAEVDRLLTFVDSRHCPFQLTKVRRRPTATRPKVKTPAEQSILKRRSTLIGRPKFEDTALAHIDKALVKRIMAVLPSDECEAYVAQGMPDPRVVAAAFANLSVEFRHWA